MEIVLRKQKFNDETIFSDIEKILGVKPEFYTNTLHQTADYSTKMELKDFGMTYPTFHIMLDDVLSPLFYIRIPGTQYSITPLTMAFVKMYFTTSDSTVKLFADRIEDILPAYRNYCDKGLFNILKELQPNVIEPIESDPAMYAIMSQAEVGYTLRHNHLIRRNNDHWVPFFAKKYAEYLIQ